MSSSGVKQNLMANSGTAGNMANTNNSNAAGLYGTLAPALTSEAANPQGFGSDALAKMNTDSQQSIGGSTAGAVGEGALEDARTGNAGGSGAALDASAQAGMRQNSSNALRTDMANASLKNDQQQAGLSGLSSLYGTNVGAANNALGTSNQALNVAGQQKPFWQTLLSQGLDAGAKVGSAYLGG